MATISSSSEENRGRDVARDGVKQFTLFATDRRKHEPNGSSGARQTRLGSIWATEIELYREDPHMVMVRWGEDIIAIFEATEITWELHRGCGGLE
jgi:hypothetical protein